MLAILFRTTITILLAAYCGVVLLVYLQQKHLLYIPDKTRPTEQQLDSKNLVFWPEKNAAYRGITSKTPPINPKGTVIVFHGNAGSAWQNDLYINALSSLGYRAILAEYPGYGGRPGDYSEQIFVADAKQSIEQAYAEFGAPLYLWGESMGCGIISAARAQSSIPIEGIILLTPWDTLPDLAQSIYWYIPARWLAKDHYDNISNLQSFTGPIAVLIAKQDEFIPNKHSQRLYDSLPGQKNLWWFDSGHNDWPYKSDETWWREVMTFVSNNGAASSE